MMNKIQNIPEGWEVKKLGSTGIIVSGGTPDTNNCSYWDGDILWLTPSEVTKLNSRYVTNTERKITKEGLKKSSANIIPKNSLIICSRATVGNCCINKVEMSTNQGFKNLIPNNCCIDFLYYLIVQNKKELIRKACGSTFLEISMKDINNLSFPIPSLAEQERIAEVLGCWDEGIEKIEKIISLKEQQKNGLMQKLLTGKTRLSGFSEPWKEVKLGDLVPHRITIEKGTSLVSTNLQDGLIPVIAGGKTSPYKHNQFTHNTPCITISASGAYAGYVWYHDYPIWASDCNVLYGKDYNTLFLYHVLKLKQNDIYHIQTGGAQPHVYATDLKIFKIPNPSLTEQSAIANIFSAADAEITLLKQKLALFKKQKNGLMQQLLTGKTRLKFS